MNDVIFDVDGTLADSSWRLTLISGPKKNWHQFFTDSKFDQPIEAVAWLAQHLKATGCRIIICTGRPEKYRDITKQWLVTNGILFDDLFMRRTEDFRADHLVKKELLDLIRRSNYNPIMVFEDKPSVVKMWRDAGLICAQIAEGES